MVNASIVRFVAIFPSHLGFRGCPPNLYVSLARRGRLGRRNRGKNKRNGAIADEQVTWRAGMVTWSSGECLSSKALFRCDASLGYRERFALKPHPVELSEAVFPRTVSFKRDAGDMGRWCAPPPALFDWGCVRPNSFV
jgi:hypothetical protein